MRTHLIALAHGKFEEFQDAINYRLSEIESIDSGGRIIDVKFEVYMPYPGYLFALILWEPKDVEDQTRTGLREGPHRGRYKTW
jgi:hypothetical protein